MPDNENLAADPQVNDKPDFDAVLDAPLEPLEDPNFEAPKAQPSVGNEVIVCWENNEDRPCTSQVGIVNAQHEDGTVDVLLSDGVVLERVGAQSPGVSPYYA